MGCTQKLCAVRAMRNTMNKVMGRQFRVYVVRPLTFNHSATCESIGCKIENWQNGMNEENHDDDVHQKFKANIPNADKDAHAHGTCVECVWLDISEIE